MTKRNLKKLFTMQGIISLATSDTWNPIAILVAAFMGGISSLQTVVNQITSISGAQSLSVAGGAALKNFYRNILNRLTFAILNAAKGYALSIQNFNLAEELSKSLSDIAEISDKNIAEWATNMLNKIQPLLVNLGPWGISGTTISNWQTAITNYQSAYLLPKTKKENKKTLTNQENNLVKAGMDIVKSTLDTAISSYTDLGHDDFVQVYKQYRKIGPVAGLHHTRLNSLVVNELGEPFVGAIVTVNELTKDDRTFKSASATTDINGYAKPEKFEQGDRMVTCSGPGIVSKTFGPFHFVHGKAVNQVFTCEPAFDNIPASKTESEKVSK